MPKVNLDVVSDKMKALHENKVDCWCGPVVDRGVVYHGDLGFRPVTAPA